MEQLKNRHLKRGCNNLKHKGAFFIPPDGAIKGLYCNKSTCSKTKRKTMSIINPPCVKTVKVSPLKNTNMNALKNKVQLIGNLGNAPEIKNTDNGKKLARFSIATDETFHNAKGEKVTETTWHNLVAWGKLADIAEKYLHKGTEIVIEGKLINRSYNDKEGNKKHISEVQVNEMLMLGSKEKAKG